MIRRGLALAALLFPGVAAAQLPTTPARPTAPPDTGLHAPRHPRVPGDTTHTDTASAPRELVKWAEADSVMSALLARHGYTITRYQGKNATWNAAKRTLDLSGESAVQHEQAILVADTIVYDDSLKIVFAASAPRDTIVLRDPTMGTSDVVALGGMEYDLTRRRGIVREMSTSSAEAGQTWFVHGGTAAVVGDTTGQGRNVSYAEEGAITSCDLTYPHYHFQSKEIKMISKRLLVARPAVLYIADIPVMWLPFIFQDMRSGRRSGIIPPRFGLTDIVRNSPTYTRQIDNLGYYFAINDYMDATLSLGWRSANGDTTVGNIGWTRYDGEWRYAWLDRFLSGGIRTSYSSFSDNSRAFNVAWSHNQQFSRRSTLSANLNYASNTAAIQRQAFNVAQVLATIASQLNLQQGLGPANISIGGTRTQYVGRAEVQQNFPNLNVTTPPLSLGSWFVWSPSLAVNNSEVFNREVGQFQFTPASAGTGFDSTSVTGKQRSTSLNLQTPLRIFGFTWQNTFSVNDNSRDYPQPIQLIDLNTGQQMGSRTFARTYETEVFWTTGISLPVLLQGTFNLTPSVSIVNADPSRPFWARTTFSGGRFVQQSKTLQYGLSAAPTLFGFYPGFGPFTRIRHSIQPRVSFGYSPAANISDDMLRAYNMSRSGFTGGIASSAVTFQLDQVFEAKLRSKSDTNPEGGEKIKLLSLSFSPITYDFERHRKTGLSGFTTPNFNYRVASDLLPGFDMSVDYSLYQGDVMSDTARFKPYRTGISARITLGRNDNPFAALSRIFGHPTTNPDTTLAQERERVGQGINQPPEIAGPIGTQYPQAINTRGGWTASLEFTTSRSRPIVGARVFDPFSQCQQFRSLPGDAYQRCLALPVAVDSVGNPYGGSQIIVAPPRSTLRGNLAFSLTPKWAMQWVTGYDFEQHEFSDHSVTLQRDMHDWRANFAFSRAPNGNFQFSFFISLKAEPDLKFDYRRSTYRCTGGGTGCFVFPQ